MINLVETLLGTTPSPCKHGNLAKGHAVYCHHPNPKAPRKCPIYRNYGEWLENWNKAGCKWWEKPE